MARPTLKNQLSKFMAKTTVKSLLEVFPDELSLLSGPEDNEINSPASQEAPTKGSIVYISSPEAAAMAISASAACIVVPENAKEAATSLDTKGTSVLLAKNPKLMMAKVNQSFFPISEKLASFSDDKMHPGAVIHPQAELAEGVEIGPKAVIYQGVKIGKNSKIGAGCIIESNASLGEDCLIHANTVISHGVKIGNRVEIKANCNIGGEGFGYAQAEDKMHHRIPHYGTLVIEDDVHIGANVSYDRGTFSDSRIGKNTKIDNHCHFAHNVELGENCLITAGFIVAGSTKIGSNNVFAGRTSVNGHINIGSDMTFGPLSTITNDIDKPGMYGGFPIIPYKDFLKVQASLASLPKLRKEVSKLMKKLGLKE